MTVETFVLDNRSKSGSSAAYELHLVPCKIGITGSTTELSNNFAKDAKESSSSENKAVTYIRGRKIVGKTVEPLNDTHKIVVVEQLAQSDSSKEYQQAGEISQIYNYEREGNEHRLHEEMQKFQEFLELAELIHQ
ncbi:LAME_0G03224g1_1 [Lachancea meyersii CBS 8951]|uniref:LAME_0G03224g1_1 n=1 Tax=Lachancea meyersii CBS 8951 TaxID=1266667 RepID=A0A1G4K6I4_9SACH|nr:LAME_0G03224g1_1 [Lachancea meyersii CBS 8951]